MTLQLPILDYPRIDGCSVIGGYVYRGSAIPELTGHYFYSDYCQGWLRSFRYTDAGPTDFQLWNGILLPGTVSLGRDGAGELYMLAGSGVWRIERD
jgi:hypothetical protein